MIAEIRTLQKNFNRDLLREELSGLQLETLQLAGFKRKGRFEGQPSTAPRRVSRVRQPDGTYIEDFAQPGELRFIFTVAPGAALDLILAAHDATQRTTEQTRIDQDETDLDVLLADYPDILAMNPVQLREYVHVFVRGFLRDQRNSEI